jgi:hypothetical protein
MADMASAPACTKPYSDIEEDFFRAGDEMSDVPFAELEAPPARKSVWSRLFERALRALTEPRLVRASRPPTERPADEEDWDWKIAHARARAATHPGL